MMQKLKERMVGCYPPDSVEELENMEKMLLHYTIFGEAEAIALGCRIIEESRQYGDIFVCIHRLSDDAVILQLMGDRCTNRNLDFAMKKRNTVIKTGHCSLWAMAKEQTSGGLDELFADNSDCYAVGGAFPIFVEDKVAATVAVSGLKNGMDHQVVVNALAFLKSEEVPLFSGKLI